MVDQDSATGEDPAVGGDPTAAGAFYGGRGIRRWAEHTAVDGGSRVGQGSCGRWEILRRAERSCGLLEILQQRGNTAAGGGSSGECRNLPQSRIMRQAGDPAAGGGSCGVRGNLQ